MTTREFHIGDILSVTTGHLVSPKHMDGLYDILNFMSGDNLFNYQVPRAIEECQPYLLKQHPQLEEVTAENVTAENWESWLHQQVAQFGEILTVTPVPAVARHITDPLNELKEMMPDKPIIVVQAD